MDLIAIKVTTASVAMVAVILQGLLALQLYGKATLFPVRTTTLRTWHRRQGDALLVLFVLQMSRSGSHYNARLTEGRTMVDEGLLDVRPIIDLLTQIVEELHQLNQAVKELPSQIATEVSGRL